MMVCSLNHPSQTTFIEALPVLLVPFQPPNLARFLYAQPISGTSLGNFSLSSFNHSSFQAFAPNTFSQLSFVRSSTSLMKSNANKRVATKAQMTYNLSKLSLLYSLSDSISVPSRFLTLLLAPTSRGTMLPCLSMSLVHGNQHNKQRCLCALFVPVFNPVINPPREAGCSLFYYF